MTKRNILKTLCMLVLAVILIAGLWPFHAPKNAVSWLPGINGLQFGKYGSIMTARPLKATPQYSDAFCSLEIWLQPKRVDGSGKGVIFAFYWAETGTVPFSVRQYDDGLVLERTSQHDSNKSSIAVYADHIFNPERAVLVTITSDQTGTKVYADGAFKRGFTDLVLTTKDGSGRLILGNSPMTTYNWSGQIRGLAIYNRELTADEISQDVTNWSNDRHGYPTRNDGLAALYRFDEENGNVAHNRVDAMTDLLIPKRFFVVRKQFLQRPWDEYRQAWGYWKDIGVNVVGFVPLGFFFCTYLSEMRTKNSPVVSTIVLGFLVSLTIEVLQAFLPTRDSGMTDLITNTLGTAIGVIAVRHQFPLTVFCQSEALS